MAPRPRQPGLGALFLVLAASLAGAAWAAGRAEQWVITAAAGAIAVWLAGLALRALRRR